ncbi:N-acetylmuramoyl-L-alanine amidase [Bacillus alkalicellulosilyticus]|uniref:N-acetylmuramoyl-L-alanine amidase n=1 Tax=Alkalihalobacterium alkalicellulosilyticum TaxID=1912214 RepID=UPI0009980D73|nr:N-acetylmuramoyl-L-alanine amidase [Bacillus alkalicellulosilyticus]
MTRIFIDPGHGGSDSGAVGNGLQEKHLTLDISSRIRDMLLNEYENVEVSMSRTNDVSVSLSERASQANQWQADYFISIHVNAGGGTGFESYIHTSQASRTVQLQRLMHSAIINETNVRDRGRKTANFAVLRETSMPAILTENLFIDNPNDADLLSSSSFLNKIARGHVNGIVQAFNLQQKPQTMYKVQVGAFTNRANADRQAQQLDNEGYTTYIFQQEGLWKVQVGAFQNRENAEAFADELRSKNYDVWVVSS